MVARPLSREKDSAAFDKRTERGRDGELGLGAVAEQARGRDGGEAGWLVGWAGGEFRGENPLTGQGGGGPFSASSLKRPEKQLGRLSKVLQALPPCSLKALLAASM